MRTIAVLLIVLLALLFGSLLLVLIGCGLGFCLSRVLPLSFFQATALGLTAIITAALLATRLLAIILEKVPSLSEEKPDEKEPAEELEADIIPLVTQLTAMHRRKRPRRSQRSPLIQDDE